MVTVNEICALTSRKYVVQRSKRLWKTKIALVILPRFCFKEYTFYYKLLLFIQIKFLDFFNFKKHFRSHFQWNPCTYFQKICCWIRYTNAKFIREKLIFSVVLLPFCFRKKALKMLNFQTFLPLKELLVATFCETCALTSRKCAFEQGISIPNLPEKLQFFLVALLRFCFRKIAWKSKFS